MPDIVWALEMRQCLPAQGPCLPGIALLMAGTGTERVTRDRAERQEGEQMAVDMRQRRGWRRGVAL